VVYLLQADRESKDAQFRDDKDKKDKKRKDRDRSDRSGHRSVSPDDDSHHS